MPETITDPNLKSIADAFTLIPHNREIGLDIVSLSADKAVMRLAYDARLLGNPETGVVHGGVISTVMDTVCGLAAAAAAAQGTSIATLDMRIDFLTQATPDQAIVGEAECYKLTRSVAFVRGIARHDDGTAIGHCTATYMLGAHGFTPPHAAAKS